MQPELKRSFECLAEHVQQIDLFPLQNDMLWQDCERKLLQERRARQELERKLGHQRAEIQLQMQRKKERNSRDLPATNIVCPISMKRLLEFNFAERQRTIRHCSRQELLMFLHRPRIKLCRYSLVYVASLVMPVQHAHRHHISVHNSGAYKLAPASAHVRTSAICRL